MSIQHLITPVEQLDDEIRQDVIEIRRVLAELGYREKSIFKEGRGGLIYCALWESPANDDAPAALSLAASYLRVSSNIQSNNHSLVTQLCQQHQVAAERGHALRWVFVDAGITGRDDQRPAFSRMMRFVLRMYSSAPAGGIAQNIEHPHAIYTYDVYRFYRNLSGLLTQYKALQENQVELISVAERGTDFTTRDGKLILFLKGLMGEMYLDDLSRTTRDNKHARAMKGYSNASVPPFGYCRGNCLDCTHPNGDGVCPRFGGPDLWRELDGDPQVFVPHPVESVAVQRAFEWYAGGGCSDGDIAEWLSHDGLDLPDGRRIPFRAKGRAGGSGPNPTFTKNAVRDMLQNPFYAGLVVYRRQKTVQGRRSQQGKRANPFSQTDSAAPPDAILIPGRHLPLIDTDTMDRALQARGARGRAPSAARSRTTRVYPLSGILRCAHCDGAFRGNAANGDVRYYADANREERRSDCPVRAVRAETLEAPVFARVRRIALPPEWLADIVAGPAASAQDDHRRRRALASQRRALKSARMSGALSDGEFAQANRRLDQEMRRLDRQAVAVDAQLSALADWPTLWDAATPLEKKTLLHCLFREILVQDGEIVAYHPRDPFIPLWAQTGPGDE